MKKIKKIKKKKTLKIQQKKLTIILYQFLSTKKKKKNH